MNKTIKGLTYLLVFIAVMNLMLCATANSLLAIPRVWSVGAVFACVLVSLNLIYYLFLMISALFYRPGVPLADAELPEITVIVPAYNEGRDVAKTIDSLMNGDFPKSKLHIIAIDDGSADDTWAWIKLAANKYRNNVIPVKHPENRGKRQALHTGFGMAKTEVVVTADSDSIVTAGALRALVSHFRDAKTGGVAGNLRVANLNDTLPQLLDVNFVFAFDLIRSSQSVFRCVFCTPGALSAYRRSAIMPFIDQWADETFAGAPAGIGEDRALASGLLKSGYNVVFERQAVSYTKIPADYRNVCRMFLRWSRGDLRETMKMYGYVFDRLTFQRAVMIFNMLMQSIWVFSAFLWVAGFLLMAVVNPVLLTGFFNASILIWASVPAIVYALRRGGAIWAFSYAIFYMTFMFWLVPYSVLTIGNSKWLTRGMEADDEAGVRTADGVARS
ncbi:MAG: glycosyltransferase [Victivallaceae bacterium]|nr:glycosyltransferase [Victivallaceae bacterium]